MAIIQEKFDLSIDIAGFLTLQYDGKNSCMLSISRSDEAATKQSTRIDLDYVNVKEVINILNCIGTNMQRYNP